MTEPEFTAEAEFTILDAPDLTMFTKHPQTARAREYETKVNSILKAITIASFRNDNPIDGVTVIDKGPALARALANVTDVSDKAAKALDFLTTPENPWWGLAFAGMSFGLQLLRNHEQQAARATVTAKATWKERRAMRKVAKAEGWPAEEARSGPKMTIRLPLGRKITVHLPVPSPKFILNAFRTQTHDPVARARAILGDERIVKALAKEGIIIKTAGSDE